MTRIGDAPIEAEYAEQMKMLAHFIDDYFNGPVEMKGHA